MGELDSSQELEDDVSTSKGYTEDAYDAVDAEEAGNVRWLETLSWPDRVFMIHNLLTPEECDHFIHQAQPRLSRAEVVDLANGDNGNSTSISDVRTSNGAFLERGESSIIADVEERIAQWVMIDSGQGEGFQVLDYKESQKYDAHFDYFVDGDLGNGGNRMLTVLIYLSDVEEGGETVFPNIAVPEHQTPEEFSTCAMRGLAIKPKKGSASVFWSLKTTGEVNRGSLHGGCPVIKGEKYSATKWIHVAHYAVGRERTVAAEHLVFRPPPPPAPTGCINEDIYCQAWADLGECDKMNNWMVGTAENPGKCLLACNRCDLFPYKP